MHKTDEPVFTWIPDELVDRLKNTPLQRGKYYFMGPLTERKETAADMWRRKLDQIFDTAGPWKINPTPYRFRHTFAQLLLQRGVKVDDVATLMGHSDPKITLKHYGHWVPERQERLTDILKSAWQPKPRAKLEPQWSPQNRPMVVTSKPANEKEVRTSHSFTLPS